MLDRIGVIEVQIRRSQIAYLARSKAEFRLQDDDRPVPVMLRLGDFVPQVGETDARIVHPGRRGGRRFVGCGRGWGRNRSMREDGVLLAKFARSIQVFERASTRSDTSRTAGVISVTSAWLYRPNSLP